MKPGTEDERTHNQEDNANGTADQKSRRFTICVYCFGVIMFAALCTLIVMNLGSIASAVGSIFSILKPILYGFFIAFALNPLQKWIYGRFIPFTVKVWKKFTVFIREKTFFGKLKKPIRKPESAKTKPKIKIPKLPAWAEKLKPAAKKSEKTGERDAARTASLILTYVVVLLLLALIFVAVIPQVVQSYTDLRGSISGYVNTAQSFVDNMTANIPVLDFGFLPQHISEDGGAEPADTVLDLSDTINNIISDSYKLLTDITPSVISMAKTFVTEAKNILIGLIISIYFLISKEKLKSGFSRVLNAVTGETIHSRLRSFALLLNDILVRFISNRFIDAVILAVGYALLLTVFGIRYAPLIAVLIGILNMIPYLGPMIGILIGSFIVFVSNPPSLPVFLVIVTVVQLLDYYLIEKKLLNSGAGLPPVWIMVSVTAAGGIAGVAGMFLAVPVFGFIYEIVKKAVKNREETA